MTDTQRLIAELREAERNVREEYGAGDDLYERAATALAESEAAREKAERERNIAYEQKVYLHDQAEAAESRLRSATRALQEIAASGPVHSMPMQCVKVARAALESLGAGQQAGADR